MAAGLVLWLLSIPNASAQQGDPPPPVTAPPGATVPAPTPIPPDETTLPTATPIPPGGGETDDGTSRRGIGGNVPRISISPVRTGTIEGGEVRFTLTADFTPSYTLHVNVEVTDSGSFLTGTIPSVITIASGTRTSDLILETDNDSVDEPHGTITAEINSGSNYLLGSPTSASMQVFDNDAAPVIPILSISADSTPVTEGAYVTFRVRANRAPSTLLYINVNATESGQFLAEVPVTEITMDAGATETLYILRTENDSTDEPNGRVTGYFGPVGTGYTINTSARSAVVQVLDNDLPPPPAPEGLRSNLRRLGQRLAGLGQAARGLQLPGAPQPERAEPLDVSRGVHFQNPHGQPAD